MIASSALHLLVGLAIATSPPADPSTCAADDLQCSAPAFAAAARRATSDAQRVQYLYFAHRAYLALSDKPPKGHVPSRDLCQAHRLIEQALAFPSTPLRGRIVDSERETLTRLTNKKIQCKAPRPGKKEPIVATADPPAELRLDAATAQPQISTRPAEMAAEPQTDDAGPDVAVAASRPTSSIGPATSPERVTIMESLAREPDRGSSPLARLPGRRLLIAGGLSLAAGLALTGTATYAGARALGARQTGLASMTLEATPDRLNRNTALEADYRQFGPVAVATGIVGGAAVVAAVVMLCVGARRKARATEGEPILMPIRTGLLFSLKF